MAKRKPTEIWIRKLANNLLMDDARLSPPRTCDLYTETSRWGYVKFVEAVSKKRKAVKRAKRK